MARFHSVLNFQLIQTLQASPHPSRTQQRRMAPSTPGADAYGPEGSSDPDPTQTKGDDGPNPKPDRSIDSHYEHRVGIWHAASLVPNAGLMLYTPNSACPACLLVRELRPPAASLGAGDAQDRESWVSMGGDAALPFEMDRCVRDDGGCGSNVPCVDSCMTERFLLSDG